MSVMVLQGRKSPPQKSRPLESDHRRHAVWIAIEYSYKLGQKNQFKFLCELGWFSQSVTYMHQTILLTNLNAHSQMHVNSIAGGGGSGC